MKHAATRALYAYWDRCRGDRAAPDRADIEPGAIRHVLGDTFIVTFDAKAGHPFRLAGTRICALFGGELEEEFRRSIILTFGGGTNEIQRDIIATMGLGLPRSPR